MVIGFFSSVKLCIGNPDTGLVKMWKKNSSSLHSRVLQWLLSSICIKTGRAWEGSPPPSPPPIFQGGGGGGGEKYLPPTPHILHNSFMHSSFSVM